MTSGVTILVVTDDDALGRSLATDARTVLGGLASIEVVGTVAAALDAAREVVRSGGVVSVAFIDVDGGQGSEAAVVLHDDDDLAAARLVLVTNRATLRGVDGALQRGAVHGMLTRPWTSHGLGEMLEAQLATSLLAHAPDRWDAFDTVLDADDRERARRRIDDQRTVGAPADTNVHPLLDATIDDAAIEAQMVTVLDRALGHPPRLRVGPGTVLIESGEDVGGIYVILEGVVQLSSRPESGGRILHENSTGSIVGLLSLASHRRAMLRCRAVTDVLAIPVTLDQLARALEAEPPLATLVTRVLIGSLARRLRRSDELQIELDRSLADLSEARAQLVASARFATLGEMSAGMAHELNNPSAALVRSLDHLLDDLAAVIDDPEIDATIRARDDAVAPPTADLRARRREFSAALGDATLARRLTDIGVDDVGEARRLARLDPQALDRIEAAARLGQTVRNATMAAERIQSLVQSLRAYARGDDGRGPLLDDVDVAAGIDDALRLVSHRTGDVEIVRHIDDLPDVTARPGALQQVWTNLITNALDAAGSGGRIEVRAGVENDRSVRVDVIDDGPGVPRHLVERIFEPRFTTKNGRVEFGLGLGLSISRQIVTEHDGTIAVESRPGHTVFTVRLPIGGPS